MNTLVYCIECEEMTHMECGLLCGHEVHVPVYGEEAEIIGVDVDFCEYPAGFAFVSPPAVEPDWIDSLEDETDFNSLELGQLLDYFGYDVYELVEA